MYNLYVTPYKLNVSFNGKKVNNEKVSNNLSEKIFKSIQKLHSSAEREITEYDYFRPVQTCFKNSDKSLYVGEVTLKISQPSGMNSPKCKKQRYLEATAYSPTKGQNVSKVIFQGDKKEILQKLKDKQLATEVEEFIKESSGMLIEDSYQ